MRKRVCPNCEQWISNTSNHCLNECHERGFAPFTPHKLRLLTDPGHGWVEVPETLYLAVARALPNQISSYSYTDTDNNGIKTYYFEEDCDAQRFGDAYITHFGGEPTIEWDKENSTENDSWIRSLPSFTS